MPIRAMNATHHRVAPGKGYDTAAGGTWETASSVDTAVPPQGDARAGQSGTGAAAGLKHGKEDSPNPTASSPDPIASS